MTNPNNSIGTNGAFGGRTSVNAFNDVMGAFSRGILSGWACNPNSGLTVSIGGDGVHRDVAIAVDNAGNKTSINNISNSPVNVTIGAAPGANTRIDAIVAYVDNPPSGTATVTDNPASCGLIVVQGTTSLAPMNPSDAQIRTAITADGASGTTAYYVVIAYITMASGTTDITSNEISAGQYAQIGTNQIEDNSVTSGKINYPTLLKWMPDYDNQVSLGSITTYTATADGWIVAHYYGYNTTEQYTAIIKINGKVVHTDTTEAQAPNGARASQGSIMLPICVGDVVTGLSSGGQDSTSYFIPGKWA